jgi:Zn-dependent metalloprotease
MSTCLGIIPPYLLERLRASEDTDLARAAVTTLEHDLVQRTRRRRAVAASVEAATTGAVAVQRTIDTADNGTTLPGKTVRVEGGAATGDPASDEAYDALGATWTLYDSAYGRNSLDGKGLPLLASVHYSQSYDNAFWNGDQMVFGDGDGKYFNRFTISVDVIGHELTHGVTQYTANLDYTGQSGALNESISDCFGSMVKQMSLSQDAAAADWLIGQGLFTSAVKGVALRSMKAPGTAYDDPNLGKDPQPATMDGYVDTTDDDGGVHTNSGIPNHAFYLAATGIGGNSWEGAGQVWYDVLTGGHLATTADFSTFAAATVAAAGARFGAGSTQATAVQQAWTQVKVTTS